MSLLIHQLSSDLRRLRPVSMPQIGWEVDLRHAAYRRTMLFFFPFQHADQP